MIWRGFGTQKKEYCVSRLMAFDAEIIGTWGCLPRHYPKVLEFVLNKAIEIKLFTELRPMSRIREVFEKAHSRKLMKRVVLTQTSRGNTPFTPFHLRLALFFGLLCFHRLAC